MSARPSRDGYDGGRNARSGAGLVTRLGAFFGLSINIARVPRLSMSLVSGVRCFTLH